MRVIGRTKPKGAMRVKASSTQAEGRSLRGAGSGLACPIAGGEYLEHTCWDPKDGELCLARMKPEETLVEVLAILTCKSIVRAGYRAKD